MKKILIAMLLGGLLTVGCTDRKEKITALAKESIKGQVAYPKQLKFIGVSEIDSAFGTNYYTRNEIMGIMTTMKKVTDAIMKRTSNMTKFDPEDNYVMRLAERQMKATDEIRSRIMQSKEKGEWSGWKIKVDYQCNDKDGMTYRAERWLFFDKKGENVTYSFELPLP